jgi:hypothetical protein
MIVAAARTNRFELKPTRAMSAHFQQVGKSLVFEAIIRKKLEKYRYRKLPPDR